MRRDGDVAHCNELVHDVGTVAVILATATLEDFYIERSVDDRIWIVVLNCAGEMDCGAGNSARNGRVQICVHRTKRIIVKTRNGICGSRRRCAANTHRTFRIGRRLGQRAMYFEVAGYDGVQLLRIE